ncbi:hypothetical protein H8959_001917 [Pygathrix nigripes]
MLCTLLAPRPSESGEDKDVGQPAMGTASIFPFPLTKHRLSPRYTRGSGRRPAGTCSRWTHGPAAANLEAGVTSGDPASPVSGAIDPARPWPDTLLGLGWPLLPRGLAPGRAGAFSAWYTWKGGCVDAGSPCSWFSGSWCFLGLESGYQVRTPRVYAVSSPAEHHQA